jgi:hypothetical protein
LLERAYSNRRGGCRQVHEQVCIVLAMTFPRSASSSEASLTKTS